MILFLNLNEIILNTTLCFDFGNTRLKCGVFIDGQLTEVLSLNDTSDETIEDAA